MIQYFYILVFLHLSVLAQGTVLYRYNDTLKHSHCGWVLMDSLRPFNFTATQSETLSLPVPVPTPKPAVIPETVTATAKTVGSVTSTASVVAISPGVVTQASRIGTVTTILTCTNGDSFQSQPLDWANSPTQISLGDGELRYVDGATLGNWIFFGSIAAIHTLVAKKWGAATVRYPGFLMLPALFLSSPTAQSAVTMIRLGTRVEQAFGCLSLLGQLSVIPPLVYFLWPTRFAAKAVSEQSHSIFSEFSKSFRSLAKTTVFQRITQEQKWRPIDGHPDYMKNFGLLFRDYRPEWYYFIVPEFLMTVASGTLGSFQSAPESSCNGLLAGATGVYGAYAVILVALHPHRSMFDRVYFGSVALIQFAALATGVIQKNVPAYQNNTVLQAAAEGIPVALQYITLARSVYDLALQIRSGYKYTKNIHEKMLSEQRLGLLDEPLNGEEMQNRPVLLLDQFETPPPSEGQDPAMAPLGSAHITAGYNPVEILSNSQHALNVGELQTQLRGTKQRTDSSFAQELEDIL